MNKRELIESLAEKTGVNRRDVENVIETMLKTITDTLVGGGEVSFTGFGTFSARERKGRIGINPQNPSQKITIPPVVTPKFKAGKNLKEALKVSGRKKEKAPKPSEPKPAEPAAAPSDDTPAEPAA